jgi:hypothetical protein
MQLDRNSAIILPFRPSPMRGVDRKGKATPLDSGRLANLAFLALLLGLAALWLVFPPVQLSTSAAVSGGPAWNLLEVSAKR